MTTRRFRVGRLLGFDLLLDATWFPVAALFVTLLASGPAAQLFGVGSGALATRLAFAGLVIAGVYTSLYLHEVAHARTADRFGVAVKDITLFALGGMANMTRTPRRPAAAFWITVAGPALSATLGTLFWALSIVAGRAGAPPFAMGVVQFLAGINIAIALFNMAPAFPMDGGRILHAALWHATGDEGRAARWARGVAYGVVGVGMGAGLLGLAGSHWLMGVWAIGMSVFVLWAANRSLDHHEFVAPLGTVSVGEAMYRQLATAAPEDSVWSVLERAALARFGGLVPVMTGRAVAGVLRHDDLTEAASGGDPMRPVAALARPMTEIAVVSPDDDLRTVAEQLLDEEPAMALVARDGRLVGAITREAIRRYRDLLAAREA